MKLKLGNDWWTAPTESERTGKLIMVSGRRGVEPARATGKYNIRAEITWCYQADASGMPDDITAQVMEAVQDALEAAFAKDPVAVLTGVYTGDGERNWIFYTMSTHIFGRKINEALAPFDLLPITVYTENDADWAEYEEMRQATEIAPEEDD